MKFYYYINFLFLLFRFKREVTRTQKNGKAFFDIEDLDVAKEYDKRMFGHLIRYMIFRDFGRDIGTVNGRECLIIYKIKPIEFISWNEFKRYDNFNEYQSQEQEEEYEQLEAHENVVAVDFVLRKRI